MSVRLLCVIVGVASASFAQSWSPPFGLDEVNAGSTSGQQLAPVVLSVANEYLVLWDDDRDRQSHDVWMASVRASGATTGQLSTPLLRLPGNQTQLAAAAGPSVFLVAWLDDSVDVCGLEVRAQAFTLGPSPLGPPLRLSMGACGADRPSVTFDATSGQWLVVWGHHGNGREVHGAWVSSSGALAVSDFVIASGPNSAVNARATSLAAGGALVVWADDRVTLGVSNILAAAVSPSGAVGTPAVVGASPTAQTAPCVAPVDTGALVGWTEGNTAVFAQLVSAGGAPLGPITSVETAGVGVSALDCLTVGVSGPVALTWVDRAASERRIIVRTVAPPALAVSAAVTVLPQVSYFGRDLPRLASDGTTFVVVAQGDADYTSGADVFARVMYATPDPVTVDSGAPLLVDLASTTATHVHGAWNGERYFVAWRGDGLNGAGSDSLGRFIAPTTGAWLGPDGGVRLSSGSANLVSFPSAAGGGPDGGFFVAWGDDGSGGQLVGVLLSTEGVASGRLVLNDGFQYVNTHVARWFVDGWASTSLKNGSVHGRRTSPRGTTLVPETVLLTTGSAPEWIDAAALGDTLLSVLVVSDGGTGVHGVGWLIDGGVFEVPVAVTTAAELEPAIAASQTTFLVAWSQSADGGGLASRDVWATRVSAQGVVLDVPPLALGAGAESDVTPTIAWDGLHFVVSWLRGFDIVAARVSEQGTVLDPTPALVVGAAERVAFPHAIGGPLGEALITWEQFDPPAGAFRPRGRLWLHNGVDAGSLDTGTDDAGILVSDGGAVDAGSDDAGNLMSDGGAPGGVQVAQRYAVGCSCGDTSFLPIGLAILFAMRKRAGSVA